MLDIRTLSIITMLSAIIFGAGLFLFGRFEVRFKEFVIILPNTSGELARNTAERMREIVEKTEHIYEGKKISFTVSFGVACFEENGKNLNELIHDADLALYQAKAKGRNRVEVA